MVVASAPGAVAEGSALSFTAAGPAGFGRLASIPPGFGEGELTIELWIKLNASPGSEAVLADPPAKSPEESGQTYTDIGWFPGAFSLADDDNNPELENRAFALRIERSGRVSCSLGAGFGAGSDEHRASQPAHADATVSPFDGRWHQITLVRRWVDSDSSDIELWWDGSLASVRRTPTTADLQQRWEAQERPGVAPVVWLFGLRHSADNLLVRRERFSVLVDEMRLWSRAKNAIEIAAGHSAPVTGSDQGLLAWFKFDEASGTRSCDALDSTRCIELLEVDPRAWSTESAPLVQKKTIVGIAKAVGATTVQTVVTVSPQNDPPTADPQAVATNEDTPIQIALTGSDVDGDTLAFAPGTGPATGSLSAITLVSSTSAEVTYTPDPDTNGPDSFTFTVGDGAGPSAPATVGVDVTPVNDSPVADSASHMTNKVVTTIVLTGSDVDGDALSFALSAGPTHGSVSTITPLTGTSAEITYTTNAGYLGPDSFTFTVNDALAPSPPALVTLAVQVANLALSNMTVSGVQTFEACTSITASNAFRVTGNVTLRAPGSVALGPGFSVASGGALKVVLKKPAFCP